MLEKCKSLKARGIQGRAHDGRWRIAGVGGVGVTDSSVY